MSQSIDWAYWVKLPEIKVFEAVALVHDTEPESEPPDLDDSSPEYRKTLRLLLACLSDRSIFTPSTFNMVDPALHGVRLIQVGAWALANGYKLADKFPRPVQRPVQISKAPPPITPIRAAASYTPLRKPEPINWAHWQKMPIVKLEEAVALSLNINPEFVIQVDEAMIRRMKIVLSNVDSGHLILNQRYSENQPKSPTSLAKFAAWAVKIELPNLPPELVALAETEPQATTASPAPAVVAASDAPARPAALAWSLKTSIKRAPGYRWPLYQTLKTAHIAGLPCPTAREVLDTWKLKPLPDLQVMPDGVKYNNRLGNPKEADLKAIGQAIKNLLNPSAG